jgi:hypothetical protein
MIMILQALPVVNCLVFVVCVIVVRNHIRGRLQ